MCRNIALKANLTASISVFDIVPARGKELLSELGGDRLVVADSITEAASNADIVFYMVPDDKAVELVLDEILKSDIKGKVIVDCSTVHPSTTRKEAARVSSQAGGFVACPVFGSAVMAEAGQLIAVPGGEEYATKKILPLCKGVMSKDVIDLSGQVPDKSTLLKLVGNTFILNMVGALSEGHVLAEKAGLDPNLLHKFIDKLFPGPYSAYSARMVSGDYYQREEPLGLVDLACKDARHAKRIAEEAGMRIRMVEVVESILERLVSLRGSKAEFVAAYGAKREEAGLPFENER